MICASCGNVVEPLVIDGEFLTVERGATRVALSPRQHALLEMLATARAPIYADWLAERLADKGWRGLHRTLHELRPKLASLHVTIAHRRGGAGEAGVYWLDGGRFRASEDRRDEHIRETWGDEHPMLRSRP